MIWVDFGFLFIYQGKWKFFDGCDVMMDFVGGGAEMLDFSRNLGIRTF